MRLLPKFAAATAAFALLVPALPARADSFVPLTADGSSWAQPAIEQWSKDVHGRGIVINYSPDGSATGRQHYIQDQADFASSDIAFLNTPDPFGGGTEASSWAYSYVPIVAGGTAMLYHLSYAGKKITNLRMSGLTLAKIFTGQITQWNDPAIEREYGGALPAEKITPVTRSDGSGASYMLTRWLWKQYPSIWGKFCHDQGGGAGCGPTEFYPQFGGSVQRNGSDQVANYVNSGFGEGSIGYDEYAYAKSSNIPVVKILNSAGYYSLPTASNVAIALQAAIIDEDPNSLTFLMQNLDHVYTNPDSRAYPLSSYNYLIVPRDTRVLNGITTGPPDRWNAAKGATLGTWMNYVLCTAQQKAGNLGYSPLPKNLVVGGFQQMDHVPGHVPTPDQNHLTGCHNPTYSDGVNHLIVDAAKPSPCDKVGAPLTCTVGGSGSTGKRPSTGRTRGGSSGNGTGGAGGTAGTAGPSGGASASAAAGAKVDPDTGLLLANGTNSGTGSGQVNAVPVSLSKRESPQNWLLSGLTAADIVAVIAVPGLIGAWLRRRRRVSS